MIAIVAHWRRGGDFSISNLPFFFLLIAFQYLLVLPHELGHALAGRLCGFSRIRIFIGSGKSLFHFQALGFTWFINRIPAGGLTWAEPPPIVKRSQYIAFSSTGLLVNLLFLLIALALRNVPDLSGYDNILRAIFWANGLVLVENLVPYTVQTSFGPFDNDGKLLYNLLFRWGKDPESHRELSSRSIWAGRFLKAIGVIILVLAAAISLTVPVILVVADAASLQQNFELKLTISALFLGITALLLWFAWRLIKAPLRASAPTPRYDFAWVGRFRSMFPSAVPTGELAAVEELIDQMKFDRAIAECERLLLKHPDDPTLIFFYAAALSNTSDPRSSSVWHRLKMKVSSTDLEIYVALATQELSHLIRYAELVEFRPACEELLELNIPPSEKIALLDKLACVVLYYNLSVRLHSAEYCVRRALELAPGAHTLKGTLGGILTELENFTDAEPLLRECYDRSPALHDQAISGFYLAVIAARRGDSKVAKALARKSLALFPEPWLTRKAHLLLPETIRPSRQPQQ